MNKIDLLKRHAINILGSYEEYYCNHNAVNVYGENISDSLFTLNNKEKLYAIMDKIVSYLCVYLDFDKNSLTAEDYKDIESYLKISQNMVKIGKQISSDEAIFEYLRTICCKCYDLKPNEKLSIEQGKKFQKVFLDSYMQKEFINYKQLLDEFYELKNKGNLTSKEMARLNFIDNKFSHIESSLSKKYFGICNMLYNKMYPNWEIDDNEYATYGDFQLIFNRELMNLISPINNEKEWNVTIEKYIKTADGIDSERLENVKIDVASYYAKKNISGINLSPLAHNIPEFVSYLDDDSKIQTFFDLYFQMFEIGYQKYACLAKQDEAKI